MILLAGLLSPGSGFCELYGSFLLKDVKGPGVFLPLRDRCKSRSYSII